MTSDAPPVEAFVWTWLPSWTTPVVCGRIRLRDGRHVFTYARSYLAREEAVPIYEPELPLRSDDIEPLAPLSLANSLRDAAPDAWGRRQERPVRRTRRLRDAIRRSRDASPSASESGPQRCASQSEIRLVLRYIATVFGPVPLGRLQRRVQPQTVQPQPVAVIEVLAAGSARRCAAE